MENEQYIESGLSVGAVKYVDTNEIITEEEYNYIKNKTPELDRRVGVIENEIDEINSSLDNKASKGEITSRDFKILNDSDKIGLDILKDEVLQSISGTAPVGPTLMNGVITPKKTTFIKSGKNLFNKNEIIQWNDKTKRL